MLKLMAWCYAAVVLIVGSWAWAVEIALRGDPREHLLPVGMFALVTMPLSSTLGAPERPFVGLALLSLVGAAQALLLFWLARLTAKAFRSAPNSRWRGP